MDTIKQKKNEEKNTMNEIIDQNSDEIPLGRITNMIWGLNIQLSINLK